MKHERLKTDSKENDRREIIGWWKEREIDLKRIRKKAMFEERKKNTTARKIMIPPGIQTRAGLQMLKELLIFLLGPSKKAGFFLMSSIKISWFQARFPHFSNPDSHPTWESLVACLDKIAHWFSSDDQLSTSGAKQMPPPPTLICLTPNIVTL